MEVNEPSAKYLAEAGYKLTDVGSIPSDWLVAPLGSVCRLLNGRAFSRHEWQTIGVPVIRLQNLTGGADYYYSTLDLAPEKFCEPGDLLYMWSATFGPRIWKGERAIYHYHIWKVLPRGGMAVRDWLAYTLAHLTEEKKRSAANGGTMLHVTKRDMEITPIRVPPIEEQLTIGCALSDLDELVESLEQLIAKKRQIKQGAMQELLTGKKRLPGFSDDWRRVRLGEVANIKTGARNNEDQVEDGAYPFFVRSDVVERIDTFSYDCEAILVPGEGNIGSIFHYVNGPFDVHQRVYAITNFRADTRARFVHYFMARHFGSHALRNSVKATVDSP